VIEFDEAGAIRVEALGGATYRQAVERGALPPRIESRSATLVRDDLARAPANPDR
jgi:hypothetical protein